MFDKKPEWERVCHLLKPPPHTPHPTPHIPPTNLPSFTPLLPFQPHPSLTLNLFRPPLHCCLATSPSIKTYLVFPHHNSPPSPWLYMRPSAKGVQQAQTSRLPFRPPPSLSASTAQVFPREQSRPSRTAVHHQVCQRRPTDFDSMSHPQPRGSLILFRLLWSILCHTLKRPDLWSLLLQTISIPH